MSDLCLNNEAYKVCRALVRSRDLCRIFAYRTRHTKCVARLFVRVAYVGSLLIEEGIHCVARLFVRVPYVGSLLIEEGIHSVYSACSFAYLMSDLC